MHGYMYVPKGGARDQILGHIKIFLVEVVLLRKKLCFKQQVLFRVDICSVTSDISWPRVGLEVQI